jgi:hypothetical protein
MVSLSASILPPGRFSTAEVFVTHGPIAEILSQWTEGGFWLFLLVVAAFGAFGGVIYELLVLKGRLQLPHRAEGTEGDDLPGVAARYLYDLGTLARILIGAAAAIVVVWVLDLQSNGATGVIAGAIVAGATGIAVFRSLQDRLIAMLATRDLVQTQTQAAAQTRTVEEIAAEIERLKERLAAQASGGAGHRSLSFSPESSPSPSSLPELDNITRLLGQARGLGAVAAGALAVPVRERVFEIVADWARVDFAAVLPESQKIVAVWSRNAANPAPDDGIVSVLIRKIREAFPKARLNLAPGDLTKDNRVETVGKLADFIEARV